MASTTWVRSMNQSNAFDTGSFLLAQIPSGSTLRRVRFSWGFACFTEVTTDLHARATAMQIGAIQTLKGDGLETVPPPFSNPNDFDPPTQRYLWWENRQPVALSIDAAGGTVSWRDSGPQEPPDVRSQVLATGLTGGDTLDVWFCYQSPDGAWDTSGSAVVWCGASVLYSTP